MLASEYATQLEFSSDYDKALHYYEEALITAKQIGTVTKGDGNKMSEADVEEHNWICKAGYYTTCSVFQFQQEGKNCFRIQIN